MDHKMLTLIFLLSITLSSSFKLIEEKPDDNKSKKLFVVSSIYSIDLEASNIIWRARRVAYGHIGTLKIKYGKFEVTNQIINGGEFKIDMNTIDNLDLEDPKMKNKLLNHLRSKDFFNIKKYPEVYFKITKIQKQTSGEYAVTGDLTIKGITNEIFFPANFEIDATKLKVTAEVTFDRTKFKVRYGSGSFFDNLGDKLIYDDVNLEISLVAYNHAENTN